MTKAQGGHRQLPGVFFCGPGGEWERERERERLPDTSWQTKATGGKTECKGDMHWGVREMHRAKLNTVFQCL